MSRNDIIRANAKAVINDKEIGLGRRWSYKRLTSAKDVDPRTYETAWTDFIGLDSAGTAMQEYDEQRGRYHQREVTSIRCAEDDPSPLLRPGDIVLSSDGLAYSILGVQQSGPGTVRYAVERDPTLRVDTNRGGGL